jgi:hypothetical protein
VIAFGFVIGKFNLWRLLDDQDTHSAGRVRAELILPAVLALIVAGFGT